MLKIGKNWGKIAYYPPQCSTKIGTTGSATVTYNPEPVTGCDACIVLRSRPIRVVLLLRDASKGD